MLVQFWSPVTIQKRCSLTTLDQPFGLGAVDKGLYMNRLESEQCMFAIEEEHKEELGPPGRVYCQKFPEWSFGIHTLPVRQYVHNLAACYDIHGYINLPVFEPDNGCCVGILELITSSNCIDYASEVHEILRALKEENLRSSNIFEDHSFYVSCVHTWTTRRNRKRSVSSISLEEIEKHIGKPIRVAAASLNVSRSTLRRCCRNLGIKWPNRIYNDKSNKTIRKRKRTESSVGLKKINKKHHGRKTMKELVDIFDVVVSRFVRRFRKSRGILRRQYRNGPDKSDPRRKLDQTEIHTSEEASNKVFVERLGTKKGLATLIEHDKHSSTFHAHSIAKFSFRISEGLVKLEELVATRFQLDFGSFKLKYVDADGDLIWIACDSALTESVDDFRQTDHQTVIRLLVLPVVHQSPNV
nr:NIN-like protein [Tanacetum cinerariifolium]